ncbi:unnamed protein product [Phytomonas sp. Hart1]|nr:unnamed protein product [Phytomonas sp. Hart1]|eukprot:CCW68328.1 unnamed protein product [Phytomonas sp. isolate Hart1]
MSKWEYTYSLRDTYRLFLLLIGSMQTLSIDRTHGNEESATSDFPMIIIISQHKIIRYYSRSVLRKR